MSSFCDIFTTEPGCPDYDPDSEIQEPDVVLPDPDDTDNTPDPKPDTDPEPDNPDQPIDNTETEDVDEETKIEIIYSVASEESPMNRVVRIQQLMFWMNRSSMAGHLVYTIVPALLSGMSFLYMFRYSTNTNYYNRFIADNTVTDYFKLGDMIQGWGGVSLWTLAFLTSLFA